MTPGRLATALGAVAVLGIGTCAWTWPLKSTRTYGVPSDDPDTAAYVRGCAARDIVMGSMVLWAACLDDRPAMKAGLLACTIAPFADLVIALERRGFVPQLFIHGSGVVGVLLAYALLRSEDR